MTQKVNKVDPQL